MLSFLCLIVTALYKLLGQMASLDKQRLLTKQHLLNE